MTSKETLSGVSTKIDELKTELDSVPALIDTEVKSSYDQGVMDGKASMNPSEGEPKLYSQSELDALIAVKVKEVQDGVQSQIDTAVASLKSDLLAKVKEFQAKESAIEGELEGLFV